MAKYILVADKPQLLARNENHIAVTPQEFITGAGGKIPAKKNIRVINLCGNYSYLSRGYYVSLLAEARGAPCVPNIADIVALSRRRTYDHAFPELNALLEKHYRMPFEEPLTRVFTGFFGRHENPSIEPAARRIFDLFRLPVFNLEIKYTDKGKWAVSRISAGSLNSLVSEQMPLFNKYLCHFTGSAWRSAGKKNQERYWLAILHDPAAKTAPSNPGALKKFLDIGKKMDIWAELITKDDFSGLLEYDALFIRETTAINNHTYRFAQKAELEGIPSMDDTGSIIKCCNKVYLNELLEIHKIDKPRTAIIHRKNLDEQAEQVTYPAVVKIPDGSFSVGTYKVTNKDELRRRAGELLQKSDIILCQEFVLSKFDWRIGVLNNAPLFATKYFMAEGHWQIYNHSAKKAREKCGLHEAVAPENVPPAVLDAALKVTRLIGDGLYGADIKETEDGRAVVIEVNDNPNIDHGVEDGIAGDALYKKILAHLVAKIEG